MTEGPLGEPAFNSALSKIERRKRDDRDRREEATFRPGSR